jgi:hypothetical protein
MPSVLYSLLPPALIHFSGLIRPVATPAIPPCQTAHVPRSVTFISVGVLLGPSEFRNATFVTVAITVNPLTLCVRGVLAGAAHLVLLPWNSEVCAGLIVHFLPCGTRKDFLRLL